MTFTDCPHYGDAWKTKVMAAGSREWTSGDG
jgi:hypothetical protein